MGFFAPAQKWLIRVIRRQPWVLFATPALAGVLFFLAYPPVAELVRGPFRLVEARELGEGVGTFLTVVGVIYALILGFTFQQAFGRQNELRQKLAFESSSLHNLLLLSSVLRARDQQGAVAKHLQDYLEHVLDNELPVECEGDVDAAAILYRIVPVLNDICSDGIADETDRVTLDAIHDELRAATRARSERLTIAARHIPRIHWFQIEFLSTLIMVGFLLLDLRVPLLEALLFSLTSSAITVLYMALFDLDYPFGGLWRVEPIGFRALRRELRGLTGSRQR